MGARDVVPIRRIGGPWPPGPRIHDDDASTRHLGEANVRAGRGRKTHARQPEAALDRASHPLPLVAHQASLPPVPVALLLGLALVVQLLALGEAEPDLGDPTLVEI